MEFAEKERERPQLSIAPLIDVVFLLLVFFMLAGSFIRQTALDLAMGAAPLAATDSARAAAETLVIDIGAGGGIALNGLAVGRERLAAELVGRSGGRLDSKITIRAMAAVPVQDLVAVMDAIALAGFSNIRLMPPVP